MVVFKFAVQVVTPVIHSPVISVYTWTLCELPSLDLTETPRYEKGSD